MAEIKPIEPALVNTSEGNNHIPIHSEKRSLLFGGLFSLKGEIMNQLNVNNFTFTYDDKTTILKNINLTFYTKEIDLITGPSGSGKSTLLNSIAGLYPEFTNGHYNGTIKFNQKNIKKLKNNPVSMMFQNPNQQFAMKNADEEITFALENIKTSPKKIPAIIKKVAKQCKIESLMNRDLNSLSGGEQQRVALAIIIAMNRPIILLDEPFASIDNKTRKFLLNKLVQLKNKYNKTIIIVDHNLEDYKSIINNMYYLNPKKHFIKKLNKTQTNQRFKQFKQNNKVQTKLSLPSNKDKDILNFNNLKLKRNNQLLLSLKKYHIYSNKATLITGENGTGKSTLFKAITKLFNYQGTIKYKENNIKKINNREYYKYLTLVFQEATKQFLKFNIQDEINLSIEQSIHNYYSKKNINKWLKSLNLYEHRKQNIYSLSEGQQKMIQILIMLIIGTPVILLDEPLKGIDAKSINFIVNLLKEAKEKQQRTILIISHQITGLVPLIDYHIHLSNKTLSYQENF